MELNTERRLEWAPSAGTDVTVGYRLKQRCDVKGDTLSAGTKLTVPHSSPVLA
jgi:hypothetical protein